MYRSLPQVFGTLLTLTAGVVALANGPFTYQGQLTQDGAPVTGPVDLTFTLMNAATDGNSVGSPVTLTGVQPDAAGRVMVTLNAADEFGTNAFDGTARWLQISVNGTPLAPRQPLYATPYALKVPGVDGHSLDAADGSPTDALYVNNSGDVGIGTTTPTEKLDVRGALQVAESVLLDAADAPIAVRQYNLFTSGTKTGYGRWGLFMEPARLFLGVAGTDYPGASKLSFGGWLADSTRQDWMTINKSGNVGIGRESVGYRLDVFGSDANAGAFTTTSTFGTILSLINGDTGGRNFTFLSTGSAYPRGAGNFVIRDVTGGSVERLFISAAGNVGINTTAPATTLHVFRQPDSPAGTLALEGTQHTFMSFYPDGFAAGRKAWLGYGDAATTDVTIANETSGGHIRLNTTGTGRTIVNVLEIAGGADVAEPFNVHGAQPIEPGMVVCIDPQRTGELRLSTQAYDRTVAGIISGAGGVQPGMMLHQEGSAADGKHPVALTGRVYCWVDADAGGPVQPGDLLTTSNTPGHAMKGTDAQRAGGATIGKAMSRLDTGRGLVLVLVNLH